LADADGRKLVWGVIEDLSSIKQVWMCLKNLRRNF
jgi:hypothetical protein